MGLVLENTDKSVLAYFFIYYITQYEKNYIDSMYPSILSICLPMSYSSRLCMFWLMSALLQRQWFTQQSYEHLQKSYPCSG